jgi:RNA polymerase sigma-70 factor (ECF subfamily)
MGSESGPSELDERVRALCTAGDHAGAATLLLRTLGGDVLRVVHARFHDETVSGEVFSRFAEDMWRGIASFSFRCSVRAWLFTLARNAGNRYLARELRRERKGLPLSAAGPLAGELERVRTATLAHLRTSNRTRVAELRAQLGEDEQLLLTLRVDRELDWREIAVVMLGDPDASASDVTREAARLRKRFQLVKDKLRRLLHGA